MTTRYEIKAWRESQNGKAYTVRIGSAWVDQKGITRLAFDALPIPDKDGRVQCFLEEPRERDDRATEQPRQSPQKPAGGNAYADATRGSAPMRPALDDGDSIPF